MMYMYALPKTLDQYTENRIARQVAYPSHVVDISAKAVGHAFSQNLAGLMSRLASQTPARLLPSSGECRFCEITAADCSIHMDEESWPAHVTDHSGPKRPYTEGNRWKL